MWVNFLTVAIIVLLIRGGVGFCMLSVYVLITLLPLVPYSLSLNPFSLYLPLIDPTYNDCQEWGHAMCQGSFGSQV